MHFLFNFGIFVLLNLFSLIDGYFYFYFLGGGVRELFHCFERERKNMKLVGLEDREDLEADWGGIYS